MAEVPEVETLVGDLREAAVGRTILETDVLQPTAVRFPTAAEFTTLLTDRIILDSNRRAKYILLSLSGDLVLAVHLALWGTVALVPTEQPRLPETLIIWHLDQEQDIRFIDKLGYARAAVAPLEVLHETQTPSMAAAGSVLSVPAPPRAGVYRVDSGNLPVVDPELFLAFTPYLSEERCGGS